MWECSLTIRIKHKAKGKSYNRLEKKPRNNFTSSFFCKKKIDLNFFKTYIFMDLFAHFVEPLQQKPTSLTRVKIFLHLIKTILKNYLNFHKNKIKNSMLQKISCRALT